MADKVSCITDLPLDILVLVFPYLDAKSFLALCSTCKAFQQPSIRLDPAYWSHATRSTFRVPNQPVVQHDGVRWQKMYRRMLTQSRVFTWGNNTHNRLGHKYDQPVVRNLARARHARFLLPAEMDRTKGIGIIADMQCGGWSTTLLTSQGTLYTVGVLDGQAILSSDSDLEALQFPAGYPPNAAQAAFVEPTVAIRQFSAGRSHILGLSDSGRIWSWYAIKKPALQVKFATIDIREPSGIPQSSLYGRVRDVVAGWSCSSAYIHGTGIVLWEPVRRARNEEETDTMLIETMEVPNTGYQRTKSRETDEEKALGEEVGAVTSHIILEHFVVFATDIGRVFCTKLGPRNKVDEILELRALRSETPSDVQGSFRSFAVFKSGGEVITTDQGYLEACWNTRHTVEEQTQIAGLKRLPALQHKDVISLAFGDYHFLALHSTGKITSFGIIGRDGDLETHIRRMQQERKASDKDMGEDGLGPYFALRVSAAGWHSGALVLVNEELASRDDTEDFTSSIIRWETSVEE